MLSSRHCQVLGQCVLTVCANSATLTASPDPTAPRRAFVYHATVIEIRRGTAHGKGSVMAVRPAPVAVRVAIALAA